MDNLQLNGVMLVSIEFLIFAVVLLIVILIKRRKGKKPQDVSGDSYRKGHIEYIDEIFSTVVSGDDLIQLNNKYNQWLDDLVRMRKNSPLVKELNKLIKQNKWGLECHVVYSPPKDIENHKVMSDCFTEAHPSHYDFDTHAIGTRFTEIATLLNMTPAQKKESIMYIKQTFVNNEIEARIFQFDLYVPKEVTVI